MFKRLTPLAVLAVSFLGDPFIAVAQDMNFGETHTFTIRPGESVNKSLWVDGFSYSASSGCALGLCQIETAESSVPIPPAIPTDEYMLTGLNPGYQYQIQVDKTAGTSGFMVFDRADGTDSGNTNVTAFRKTITATYTYGPIDITLLGGVPSLLGTLLGVGASATTQYTLSITQLTPGTPPSGGQAAECFLTQVPACVVPASFLYPDGTLFKSQGAATVYLLENGQKRPFTSAFQFNSWFFGRWSSILTVSDQELQKYPTGVFMPFKDGTLVRYQDQSTDQTVFIIQNGMRSAFTSLDDFTGMGYNLKSIMAVPAEILDSVARGANLLHIFTATPISAPPSTVGIVSISATKDGSTYSGNLSCLLTTASSEQAISGLPVILSNQTSRSYTLSCTPLSGYNIIGITPSATQTLAGGGTIGFTVAMMAVSKPPTLTGTCTANGQTSPLSVQAGIQVIWNINMSGGTGADNFVWSGISGGNTASYVQNPSAGTYNVSVVVSDSGTPKQQVTLTCPQVTVAGATVAVVAYPLPNPPYGVNWTWNLSAWQSQGSTWITQPVLNYAGNNYIFGHPQGYIQALEQLQSWGAFGPLALFISQLQSALPNWPHFTLIGTPPPPVLIGLLPDRTPIGGQPFNLTINGTGFLSGIVGYVCGSSTIASTCYANPITTLNSAYQVLLPNVQWNAVGAAYVKVVNPGNLSSGFLTITINP